MKTVFVALSLVIAVAVLFPAQVESKGGECCRPKCPKYCEDCTKPTPYCGYEPCNIFGCDCPVTAKGTCRTGVGCKNCRNSLMAFIHDLFFGKEDLKDIEVDHSADTREYLNELIANYDQSGDGSLSLQEVNKWWSDNNTGRSGVNIPAEFRKLDTDNNGKLTKREINP